jgi:hypothetical protein
MKPSDRTKLTMALRNHVGEIAADLRAKMRVQGHVRTRAQQLHADEQVAEDFDVWTDLLSRRAAVLWVLKSVYVRVLEDRGLLTPGRLLDQEAQQLFERLAPNLGETAFLRWVYRDLASSNGGLPELFSPQPAEVALPSDELSRALIAFWRHRDPDSGATWSFAEERFEGELMGDLYQDLDPLVKDRFALCQTPDFVREFILDRTLTPAIEAFGANEVRLLDPACGSGHFLIDGLKRLVAATVEKHPDWERVKVVAHALDRVVGIDLNDYACALARTRLIMTAGELAGVVKLADAARFHPHVYWADGLEQAERDEPKASQQLSFLKKVEEKPVATLTRSDVRAALKKVFATKFHVVVANPPYIVEGDAARKEYHREKSGKTQRYVSAYRQYSLASPFTERCFQLAEKSGYVGIITSNNFMRREFGKPLIEKVLARLDLSLVVDASHAHIPHHETPTVLLFGRNQAPSSKAVRAVLGKRGENGTPKDAAKGLVWNSILRGVDTPGFENEFVTVTDAMRPIFAKYPWTLQGGGVGPLKEFIETICPIRLRDVAPDIGRTTVCGEDAVYIMSPDAARRLGLAELLKPLVIGEIVRDWAIQPTEFVVYPYKELGGAAISQNHPAINGYFWKYRTLLQRRTVFGKTPEERGGQWYEHLEHYTHRLQTPLAVAFAAIASDNHFVLDRGGRLFKQSALAIKFPSEATEDEHLATLGILNSSTASFWIKQVFYPKGSRTHDVGRDGTLPENNRYDLSSTGMLSFPLPGGWNDRIVTGLARELDSLARSRQETAPTELLKVETNLDGVSALREALRIGGERDETILRRMVFLQEELDWTVYRLYRLWDGPTVQERLELAAEERPFCWNTAERLPDIERLPSSIRTVYVERRAALEKDPRLALLETVVFKRLWRGTQGVFGRYDRTYQEKATTAMTAWFADKIESVLSERGNPVTTDRVVADLQHDRQVLAVAEVMTGRPDFSLAALVREQLQADAVPSHPLHCYTDTGLAKRAAWERTWNEQRRQDAGERVAAAEPPKYDQADFLKADYYRLRGKVDRPSERFIAFTEVPGSHLGEMLYGWAGWPPLQRLKVILAIDEDLEDASVALADRIALLDSGWRLLPEVAREDPAAAARLKAELQAVVGLDGPSAQLIEDWKKRFPPPSARATQARRGAAARKPIERIIKEADE